MLRRDSKSSASVDPIEIEANYFAAEILMPASFLAKSLGNKTLDIDDDIVVDMLAKNYRVSASAMRFRLGNLFAQ